MVGTEFLPVVRFVAERRRHSVIAAGPRRTHLHPFREDLNLRIIQLLLWRHGHVIIPVIHRLDDKTNCGITRRECWTGVAAFFHTGERIQSQASLQRSPRFGSCRVALVAMLHQQRADLTFEELKLLRFISPARTCALSDRADVKQCETDDEDTNSQFCSHGFSAHFVKCL